MEGLKKSKPFRHPDDGDLLTYLDHESGWAGALRIRFHLMHCRGCGQRATKLEKELASFSKTVCHSELHGIRMNLMEAIRAYETAFEGTKGRCQITPEARKTLEEYVGVMMAAQLADRVQSTVTYSEAHAIIDQTLRLLLGGKAAASLRSKLVEETPS